MIYSNVLHLFIYRVKTKCMPLNTILEFIVAFKINIVTNFHSLPKTNFQMFHNVR